MEDNNINFDAEFLKKFDKRLEEANAATDQFLKESLQKLHIEDADPKELLERVTTEKIEAYVDYYEYWLDAGTEDEIFLGSEIRTVEFTEDGRVYIAQTLSEQRQRYVKPKFE